MYCVAQSEDLYGIHRNSRKGKPVQKVPHAASRIRKTLTSARYNNHANELLPPLGHLTSVPPPSYSYFPVMVICFDYVLAMLLLWVHFLRSRVSCFPPPVLLLRRQPRLLPWCVEANHLLYGIFLRMGFVINKYCSHVLLCVEKTKTMNGWRNLFLSIWKSRECLSLLIHCR